MTRPPADSPTTQERLEAVQRLQQLVDELRASLARTEPIDYSKARDIAQAQIERQQEEVE
jgi:hypothetical protein